MTKALKGLFKDEELIPWKKEWQNMPSFDHEDLTPKFQVIVSFACEADMEDFAKAIGRKISANKKARQLQSIWYPDCEITRYVNKRYIGVKR